MNKIISVISIMPVLSKTNRIAVIGRYYTFLTMANVNNNNRNQRLSTSDENSDGSDEFSMKFNIDSDNGLLKQLTDVLKLRDTLVSNWIVESRLKCLCNTYKCSLPSDRTEFLINLAMHYTVDHQALRDTFAQISKEDKSSDSNVKLVKYEEKLRNLLVPQYHWLFLHIGRIENGVKFLVDLRTEILRIIKSLEREDIQAIKLQQLNSTLVELLSLWFSVGFLTLQRITWKSSCEMLEKISSYEVVHPIRNWTDLKRRVGPYRRCFVFTHSSMPDEPLVVLHTALSDKILSSMSSITTNPRRMSRFSISSDNELPSHLAAAVDLQENVDNIKAAIFYSVTSTQDGLHGIELGNYLIKRVVTELISEFPCINQFSTLSPIPNFKKWLYDKLKVVEKSGNLSELFSDEEISNLREHLENENICAELRKCLNNNEWLDNYKLVAGLELPLMRLCAYYLYIEKRRSCAFDSVAHFHLRNGAVMWRMNWLADTSPRGLTNSCGIMMNYRYFLNEAETNSRNYIEKYSINASDQIINLVKFFQKL